MKLKNLSFSILVFIIFFLFYCLNLLYPLLADDWTYSFIYGTDNIRVKGIFDIFISQYNHYFSWGGRTPVHLIAQFLLLAGTTWSNILNSIVFILYLLTIYKTANLNNTINIKLFLLILFISYLLVNPFISCTLWLTVSSNYLWSSLIILLFIYQFYLYYLKEDFNDNLFRSLAFLIFGIIAGWTNENMFFAQCFFISSLFLLLKKHNQKIPKWFISGFIGLLIGGCFLIFAPGNFQRAEYLDNLFNYTFSEKIKVQLYEAQKRFVNQILPLSLVYLVLLWYSIKKNITNYKIIYGSLVFFFSGQIAWLFMIISPTFPSRATFGITTLIISAIGILLSNIKLERKYKSALSILTLVLLILSSIRYYNDVINIKSLNHQIKERESIIAHEKLKGNYNIIFYRKIEVPKRYGFEELSEDPNYWLNKIYSNFYNVNSVKLNLNK